MPLFIPSEKIGNRFSELLDKYPVSPYLDKRESFIRWVNFIHNKINYTLGKEEFTLEESIARYESEYTNPKEPILDDTYRGFYSQMTIFALFCVFIYYLYRDEY